MPRESLSRVALRDPRLCRLLRLLAPPFNSEVEQLVALVDALAQQVEEAESALLSRRARLPGSSSRSQEERRRPASSLALERASLFIGRDRPAAEREPHSAGRGAACEDFARDDEESEVGVSLGSVRQSVLVLYKAQGVCDHEDVREARRHTAATAVERLARGATARARRKRCALALQALKRAVHAPLLQAARFEIVRQRKIEQVVQTARASGVRQREDTRAAFFSLFFSLNFRKIFFFLPRETPTRCRLLSRD